MTESPQGLPADTDPTEHRRWSSEAAPIPQSTIDDAIWTTVRATDAVHGTMDILRAVYALGRLHAEIEERFGRNMLRRHLRDDKMRSYFPADRHVPTLAESLLAADDKLRTDAQRAARVEAALDEVRRNLTVSDLFAFGLVPEATVTGPGVPIRRADGPRIEGADDRVGPIPLTVKDGHVFGHLADADGTRREVSDDDPRTIVQRIADEYAATEVDPRIAAQRVADDLA